MLLTLRSLYEDVDGGYDLEEIRRAEAAAEELQEPIKPQRPAPKYLPDQLHFNDFEPLALKDKQAMIAFLLSIGEDEAAAYLLTREDLDAQA